MDTSTHTRSDDTVTGGLVDIDGIECYRIDGVEHMAPFLMTVVSDTDLWMFVSSAGPLTAGRVDADRALFPYETDDRLHRSAGITGPVTVIARTVGGRRELWRPFGRECDPAARRSIAKSVLGDRLLVEEHHSAWGLTFRATWTPSDRFGWVRTAAIVADDGAVAPIELEVLDGILDVMPAGIDAHLEQIRSNLVDAYKRSECGPWGTLAVYSVESLITDRAEPAESLTATVVWSDGFDGALLDLDGGGVTAMLDDVPPSGRQLVTGRPGAYLLRGPVVVPASGSVSWSIVLDTPLSQAAVLASVEAAASTDIGGQLIADVAAGSARLRALLEAADAVQTTADPIADAHHLSNVLFNSMRGGVFPYGHDVPVADFADFLAARNHDVSERHQVWLTALGSTVAETDLRAAAAATGDPDLVRLALEYLPLTFSRRHGDPSRPWNRFSIRVRNAAGGQLLSYEGNWRDIFQNWEALLQSFPAYLPNVVAKFVNASTIDGYNPYRISRDGIDWEVPDPDDPWSHIGYWGDHQIIYLLRLLETWRDHQPDALVRWLDEPIFVYADVPYRLADHDDMVRDPRNTITYDSEHAAMIEARERAVGSDGRLLADAEAQLVHVGLLEKLLVPALAKLSSFVPGGGIWLNTQRPEWNDANNALAGPGLSMVTLYQLRRYLDALRVTLTGAEVEAVRISRSVAAWLDELTEVLAGVPIEVADIDDHRRRSIVDALGRAGEAHRRRVATGEAFDMVEVPLGRVRQLCEVACARLEPSISGARRADGLYHSYNRVSFPTPGTAQVDHLGPMLEGQVAVLSSGALDTTESLHVIDALFASTIYRPDQHTFMLYPATRLPSFVERNLVPATAAATLLNGDGEVPDALRRVVELDPRGRVRFRPGLPNAEALGELLDRVGASDPEREAITRIYEDVFHHRSFTGRSGSMYGYEGIGSVYWHMVAKLLLAVQETYWSALEGGADDEQLERLVSAYRRVRAGLGFCKSPAEFGAIPTDCYSHTPAHAGAQQPGMTGQVKEEILTRFGEIGVRVVDGRVTLSPGLLVPEQVLPVDADGVAGAARLTYCSVPVTIERGEADAVAVVHGDGAREQHAGRSLTADQSRQLFARSGSIARIEWTLGDDTMRAWSALARTS